MTVSRLLVPLLVLAGQSLAGNFTISNGQIFTPGFVVLNAPQPDTPLGGGRYYALNTNALLIPSRHATYLHRRDG